VDWRQVALPRKSGAKAAMIRILRSRPSPQKAGRHRERHRQWGRASIGPGRRQPQPRRKDGMAPTCCKYAWWSEYGYSAV